MKHLLKSWLSLLSGPKKFLAADLSHRLSRIINRRKFEVVFEGFIDLHNIDSEQPDVVVYHKEDNLRPVMILELCNKENLDATMRTIEIISKIYHIEESFIYEMESKTWYLLKLNSTVFEPRGYSDYFHIDINKLVSQASYFQLSRPEQSINPAFYP